MNVTKVTPIVVVAAIEPVLPLWVNTLGFEKTVGVSHGNRLGFVILVRGDIEVMLQTHASIAEDLPAVGAIGIPQMLYATVASMEDTVGALGTTEVLVPRRKTFYGADEIWVRDASGAVIGFAEPPKG